MSAVFRYRLFGLLTCAILSLPNIAFAAKIPLDEAGFTTALAKALQAALPSHKVSVSGALALTMEAPDGKLVQGQIETIYDFCKRNPQDCDAGVSTYVAKISATFSSETAVDRSLLRAIVRPSGYLDTIRKAFADHGEPPIAPLLGDLWIVCVIDMPQAIRSVTPADLAKLKLTREEALAIAIKNDAALLPPVELAGHPTEKEYIGFVSTGDYEASRLILPESWAVLTKKYSGELLVAAPSTDIMIYGDARKPDALPVMREIARAIAMKAKRQLSTAIFRWTPNGWVVASP